VPFPVKVDGQDKNQNQGQRRTDECVRLYVGWIKIKIKVKGSGRGRPLHIPLHIR
jgi:hypothetical protein